jgi:T5orf172 domain
MHIRYWMMRPSYASYRERGGFIYVICTNGMPPLIKIGISANPSGRLAQLRTASAAELAFSYIGALNCSGYEIEAAVHRILARYRISGEWFNCSPEIGIAAISVASSKLGAQIASVDPVRVDEIVAAVSWNRPQWTIVRVLKWCYFVILAAIFGIFIIVAAIAMETA